MSDSEQFLREVRKKIEYGVPGLSLEEQKKLYEIASGEQLPRRKRCLVCNAEGCLRCNFTGYKTND